MKHATRMAMTWHAMKNSDKRGVHRHHGSDPADIQQPHASVKILNVSTRYFFEKIWTAQNFGVLWWGALCTGTKKSGPGPANTAEGAAQ